MAPIPLITELIALRAQNARHRAALVSYRAVNMAQQMSSVRVEAIRLVSPDAFDLDLTIDSRLMSFRVQRTGGDVPLMTAPHEFWLEFAGSGKLAAEVLCLVLAFARGEHIELPRAINSPGHCV